MYVFILNQFLAKTLTWSWQPNNINFSHNLAYSICIDWFIFEWVIQNNPEIRTNKISSDKRGKDPNELHNSP